MKELWKSRVILILNYIKMNKDKVELYAKLYAFMFFITETADNEDYKMLFDYASKELDKVDDLAFKDLTPEEWDYYKEETEDANRRSYEEHF